MATVNFTISFDVDLGSDPSGCVVIWYGQIIERDCVSPIPSINDVVTWNRTCANVINGSNVVPLSLTIPDSPDNEDINQCSYKIKVVISPCCFLGIGDCNDIGNTPNTPTGLTSGTYSETTLTLPNNMDYSGCKRYIIGSVGPAGPSIYNNLMFSAIEYTPCFETSNALCAGQTYTDDTVLFEPNGPGVNFTACLLENVNTYITSLGIDILNPNTKVIEVCSKTRPVLYINNGSGNVPLVEGTDYSIVELSNHSYSTIIDLTNTNTCCHNCKKYGACNDSERPGQASCTGTFIVQDCNDGLLKKVTLSPGQFKQGCIISAHAVDCDCTYTFNANPPLSGAINITGWYSCDTSITNPCNSIPNN